MVRSGSPYSTPRDANRVPLLVAASTADGVTPVVLEADPTTHALVTSGSGGGGGADVQYTDGAVAVTHPVGTIPVFNNAGTITAVSAANPLPVSATISTAGLATSANQTNGTQLTQLTDGTNVTNILKSDGTAAGQNAELVAGTYLSVPFSTTSVAMIGTTDVGNYRWVSVQINLQGTSSSVTFQSSNDNTNWQSNALTISSSSGTIAQTTTVAGLIYHGPVTGRYFRLNVTGISAGTTAGVIIFSTEPTGLITTNANQNGTWNINNLSGTVSLPTGAATSANQTTEISSLSSINAKLPTLGLALPAQTDNFIPTMQVPQKTWRNGFDRIFAAGFDTAWMTTVVTGSGMTVAQSGGSATITTGTTANSETIGRSLITFDGSMTIRYSMNLSQRIANQTFYVEMVDLIGDGLALTINSATSVTVTIPSNPFTSANVGQSMYIGNFTGTAAQIPGRYAIASVSGNNVTFTVAGFPATGSGTASLFGWNYHHIYYDSTTATQCNFDSQRNGWNSGETLATINTTASPGHVGTYGVTDGKTVFSDQLSASSTTLELTQRGSRVRNVPVDGTQLYAQIRIVNGSSAPATTTTWTIGFFEIDNYVLNQMSINNIVPQSANTALPTQVLNTPAVTISSGTITTVTTVSALGIGTTGPMKAEDVASITGDQGIAAMVLRRDTPVANANVSADGDYTNIITDNFGRAWVNDQNSPTGTLLNTYSVHLTANATTTPTAVTSYISSIAISNEVGGTTSTITIQDKSGTPLKLVNGAATTALTTAPTIMNFQTPVKMVSGIDIITAGAVAATVDVWINYYQ